MTRKDLEAKREVLMRQREAAIAKANQATGAIAMVDQLLAEMDQPEARANGHTVSTNGPQAPIME